MVYKTFLFSATADATNEECPRPDTPGEEADHDHHQGQDLLQPEDLSLKRPEARECLIKTEAEAGLFRPYCLKDPVEYKYDQPPCLPRVPQPQYIQYRNIEDLATAQAILDLSSPNRRTVTAPAPSPSPQAATSPDYRTSDIKTEEDAGSAAVFKINGGRTTAYTYEVGEKYSCSFSLHSCFRPFLQVMAVPRSNSL